MKHQKTIVSILLNVLFCVALIWFFSRNAFLRPYLGSTAKEGFSGLLLLIVLYTNYYILYPKLYRGHSYLYWVSVAVASLVAECVELAIGLPFIVKCNSLRIDEVGFLHFFFNHLILIFGRNLAFNFIPYLLRDRKQLQQSLETETKIVYQYARLLDVCDKKNNCQHIPVDEVFYCIKDGNYTYIHTVNGTRFTRYCSIKYLEQHLGNKDFIRISPSIIVPFQHIASCNGESVIMKEMPWTETPLTFNMDTKQNHQIVAIINSNLHTSQEVADSKQLDNEHEKSKRSPSVPPEEKLHAVLNYVREHPCCRSTEIIFHTSYSMSTVERCLAELKKQGLIEYSGSKKKGGYSLINADK